MDQDMEKKPLAEETLDSAGGSTIIAGPGFGVYTTKPDNCGGKVDQYAVKAGMNYYYHDTDDGRDQWIWFHVESVYEKPKLLWFTERYARVSYIEGRPGELPLDKDNVYSIN